MREDRLGTPYGFGYGNGIASGYAGEAGESPGDEFVDGDRFKGDWGFGTGYADGGGNEDSTGFGSDNDCNCKYYEAMQS